jgi:hypothetical protein
MVQNVKNIGDMGYGFSHYESAINIAVSFTYTNLD